MVIFTTATTGTSKATLFVSVTLALLQLFNTSGTCLLIGNATSDSLAAAITLLQPDTLPV